MCCWNTCAKRQQRLGRDRRDGGATRATSRDLTYSTVQEVISQQIWCNDHIFWTGAIHPCRHCTLLFVSVSGTCSTQRSKLCRFSEWILPFLVFSFWGICIRRLSYERAHLIMKDLAATKPCISNVIMNVFSDRSYCVWDMC